ncbi:MAG: LysR family transcriptional regulator, partial [Sphingobium sp.]
MELRHLRYFLAVAEGENFRSAATRLHVSQPALSKQIQDLEAELGFDLFRREGRRVRLTEAGLSFAESAGQILEQLKHAIRHGRSVAEGTEGTLTIGFNEIATRHPLVPTAFQRVRLALPNLDLNLAPLVSPDQLRAIETGEVDAGFVYLFDHSRPGLASMEVSLDPWALAVPTGH